MNERGAGRKRKFDKKEIEEILELYHKGHSVSALAGEYGVSRQTMSFYINNSLAVIETDALDEEGMVVRSFAYWKRLNRVFNLSDDELANYNMRIDFMLDDKVLTSILADMAHERVVTYNYYDNPMKRAFGVVKNPKWEDFILFLEDRCMPRSRDRLKDILRDLHLDFYDPLLIVRKTGGRVAEDRRYLKITDYEVAHENL